MGGPLAPVNGSGGRDTGEGVRAFVCGVRWDGLGIPDVVQLKKSGIQGDYIWIRTHKNQKPMKLVLHPSVKESLRGDQERRRIFLLVGPGESEIVRWGLAANLSEAFKGGRRPYPRAPLAPYVRDRSAVEGSTGFGGRCDFGKFNANFGKALLAVDRV